MGEARVSMAAFQRAYADLAASPRLCLAVRADPATTLAPYDLDERERRRLAGAVWQRGMDANCTLYRTTRITALHSVLPLTLDALGSALRHVLDSYWEEQPLHDVRFAQEAARFIAWLEHWPGTSSVPGGAVIALARRELAAEQTRLTATA